MIHGSATGTDGDELRSHQWYRQAKETKRGEMGGRESQHLIVPLKRGNQTEGPRRGKEVPSHEPLKGNMPGTLRPEPCPRNDDGSRGSRIHEMRNRVRVMCKPGSVGDLGGQPPRSTRPEDPQIGLTPRTPDPEDPRCAVAGPTVQRTGSRSFPIASASSVSRAVVVVRHAKRCSDTGIRSLATIVLKIQEALSISPVKSISLLHSQASRRSPRIWLPSPSHFVRCVTVLSSIPESLNRKVPTCLPNEPVSAARSTGNDLGLREQLGCR